MFEEADFMAEFEDDSGDEQLFHADTGDKKNFGRTASILTNKDIAV